MKLVIIAKALIKVENPIVGFIIKDSKGQEIIGDNTRNKLPKAGDIAVEKDKIIRAEFVFTNKVTTQLQSLRNR